MGGLWEGQNVLITGASSGIGLAMARAFAAGGANLLLAARRVDRLQELADEFSRGGSKVAVAACDVTRDGDLADAVAMSRSQLGGPLHVAVANAGFGVSGPFDRLGIDDYRRQFETNVFGVLRTVEAALPDLRQTRGRLAVIGSVMGYMTTPNTTPYTMSKYAVRALASGLWQELRPDGVSVTHVAPGYVRSEIWQVDNQGVHRADRAVGFPRLAWPADRAANAIVRAIHGRKREAIITGHGKLGVWIARHIPWLINAAIDWRVAKKARARVKGPAAELDVDETQAQPG